MKKAYRFIIIFLFFILSCSSLLFYFYCKRTFVYNSIEIAFSRFLMLMLFNFLFFSFIFLLNFEYYKRVFKYVLLFMVLTWVFIYVTALIPSSRLFWSFWEIITLISFSMIAPGLIVYIVYDIKKITAKFEAATILGKYHLHEGFVGIIFLIIGFFLLGLRSSLLFLSHPFYRRSSLILLFVQILSFIFLYLGSFFFFRDWRDIIHLKFIEIKSKSENNLQEAQTSVFNQITKEDLNFFNIPKLMIYPLGMLLTIFSVNMVIYGTDFLPYQIFNITDESVIQLGYFICVIAGGLIGIDWYRIFKIFYPEFYETIEKEITRIKHNIL